MLARVLVCAERWFATKFGYVLWLGFSGDPANGAKTGCGTYGIVCLAKAGAVAEPREPRSRELVVVPPAPVKSLKNKLLGKSTQARVA